MRMRISDPDVILINGYRYIAEIGYNRGKKPLIPCTVVIITSRFKDTFKINKKVQYVLRLDAGFKAVPVKSI